MSQSLSGRRVLLVEDAPLIAADLQENLESLGVLVIGPAHDLQTALDLASRETIDAAIIDLNLRGVLSFPVADSLTARATPFLFTTGYGDDAIPHDYDQAPRLMKPALPQDVIAALKKIMPPI